MVAAQSKDESLSPKFAKSTRQPVALVAGGAGFLGSYLCETLIAQNCAVICLDNLLAGSRENIKNLLTKSEFLFIEADINQEIPSLPEGLRINYVFHLAGIEKHYSRQEISLENLLVNSIGTRNLLELARKHGAKFLLASSADFGQGSVSATTLNSYFGPSALREQKLTYQESKRYAEALAFEYYKKYNLDLRVVRVMDVYGPRMDLNNGTQIAEMLKQALEGEHFKVKGDGLEIGHPTYVNDVIFGMAKAMFAPETTGGIFHLVNPQKVTVIGLIDTLKKVVGRNMEVSFVSKEESIFPYYYLHYEKTKEILNWQPKVSLPDGLEKTIQYFKKPFAAEASEGLVSPPEEGLPKTVSRKKVSSGLGLKWPKISFPKFKFSWPKIPPAWLFSAKPPSEKGKAKETKPYLKRAILFTLFSLVVIGLVSPILSLAFHSVYGSGELNKAAAAFKEGSVESAYLSAEAAEKSFRIASRDLLNISWLMQMTGVKPSYAQSRRLVDSWEDFSAAVKHSALAAKKILNVGQMLNTSGEMKSEEAIKKVEKEITKARLELDAAKDSLSLANLTIREVNEGEIPDWLLSYVAPLRFQLTEKENILASLKEVLSVLPRIISLRGKSTYLLLFQNNRELRPTGGAITGYGLVSLENGQIKELTTGGINQLDKQLKEKVEPPAQIKKYLNQDLWYLKDANWDPDFDKTSSVVEWFFEKETGRKVDGVIALDLKLMQDLLKVLGEVTVTSYQEKVNAVNFLTRVDFHQESAPAGSEKDFVSSVAEVLLEELLAQYSKVWPKLAEVLYQNLEEKHLLISARDDVLESVVSKYHWDGRLSSSSVHEVEDYLLVVNSNMGRNPTSALIKSQVDYQVVVGQNGQAEANLKLTYQNQGISASARNETYKDYLRVYVPEGARFKKLIAEETAEVTTGSEGGKEAFGFYLELPPQKTKTFTLVYDLPFNILPENKIKRYHLLVQKQPGKESETFNFSLSLLNKMKVIKDTFGGTKMNGNISYQTQLRKDKELLLEVN
jgi:nucleoside-diphosphate-sugar epimerase